MICIAFGGYGKQLRSLHMTNSGLAISNVLLMFAIYFTTLCWFMAILDMYETFSSHLKWSGKNSVVLHVLIFV